MASSEQWTTQDAVRAATAPSAEVLVERAPVILAALSFDGRIVIGNEECLAILGHSAGAVAGTPLANFVHPEDLGKLTAACNDVARGAGDQSFDALLRTSDGSYRSLYWTLRRDTKRGVLLAAAYDFSNRKEDEAILKRRARLASLCVEIWAGLNGGHSSQSILSEWAILLAKHVDASDVGIWTLGKQEHDVTLRASARRPLHATPSCSELDSYLGLVREVGISGQSRLVEMSRCDGPAGPFVINSRQTAVKSAFFCPIRSHARVLAVVGAVFGGACAPPDARSLERAAAEMGAALAFLCNQEKLAEAKRTYDALLRSTPLAVCRLDVELNVSLWNAAAERLLGWPTSDVVGRALPIFGPDERGVADNCLKGALAGKSTARLETKIRSCSGRAIDASISVIPFYGSNEGVDGVWLSISDLTDRKRVERRLSLARAVTRVLTGAKSVNQTITELLTLIGAHFGWLCGEFWSVNPATGELHRSATWRSALANAAEFEIDGGVGTSPEPVDLTNRVISIGKPLRLPRFSSDRTVERAALAARCGIHDAFGLPIVADQAIVGVILFFADAIEEPDEHFVPFFEAIADQVAQFVLHARACESLRKVEGDLRQAEKMDSIGRLVGGVAHDFNNLLTVILGYGELVLEQVAGDSPLRDLLSEVVDAGKRASGLTRQLLAFCRKEVFNPVELDLNAHVDGMQKMLRRLIGANIELTTDLAGDLRHVYADPGQIEQVLMNLIVNARDAITEDGRITIETTNVEISRAQEEIYRDVPPGEYVMMSVSDNGCGMDEATRARIFEPFFTTKGAGKGTGMGLATVREIVEQCRGHIAVESESQRGTTFRVLFPPIESGLTAWEVDSAPQSIPRGTETVLVVDDEPRVRSLMRRLLAVRDYRVLEAANGAEAIELCRRTEGPIDLLLTDVVMPEMNGVALSARIQAIRPNIKVLFVSAYRDKEIERLGLPDLSARFLQKPFTTFDLAAKVREILDS